MNKGERLENAIVNSPHKNIMEFSKVANVPYTTIKSMIQRDLKNASVDNVIKISRILGVSVEYLTKTNIDDVEESRGTSRYNYFPTSISAGLPFEVDGMTKAEKIPVVDVLMGRWAGQEDVFLTKIYGDSMDKVMQDGSLIAIKPMPLESINNGDIVVFSDNHEYSVKHYHKYGDSIVFRPNSHSEEHQEQQYNINDNITIHGKVVLYIVEMD